MLADLARVLATNMPTVRALATGAPEAVVRSASATPMYLQAALLTLAIRAGREETWHPVLLVVFQRVTIRRAENVISRAPA